MSNEWKMVPVEPTDDMIFAFAEAWYSKRQCIDDPDMLDAYRDMLAVAPVPPAGDVEVLGCAIKDYPYSLRHSRSELDKLTIPFGDDQIVELVDRAHVTRLTAENDDYKAGQERYEQLIEDLQSELTNARELLTSVRGYVNRCAIDGGRTDRTKLRAVDDFLARQSAPAAKGGE